MEYIRRSALLFAIALVLEATVTLLAFRESAADSPKTYSFAVTDIAGLEELQREFEKFQQVLSDATGLTFKLYPVTSRTAVVEALVSKRVDFVLTGPAEYVVIRKKTEATPLIGFSRPDYFSCIIVRTSSGITSVSELKGKKIGFGDLGSTSYHLAPLQLLRDGGLNSESDFSSLYLGKQVAWSALKRGDVAALGMNYERFVQIRNQDPEVKPGDFRVVARGPDLPFDVIVAGPHIDPAVNAKLREAFATNSQALVDAVMTGKRNDKYRGLTFITNVDDKMYNYVRGMYRAAGYPEFGEFIGNG